MTGTVFFGSPMARVRPAMPPPTMTTSNDFWLLEEVIIRYELLLKSYKVIY